MVIEARHMEMIEQCEARIDELNEGFEKDFILGGPKKGGGNWPPIRDAAFLSEKRKEILEKIVTVRLLGQKYKAPPIVVDHGSVSAEKTNDEGWVITIANQPVGTGMSKKEAATLAKWLHGALHAILAIPTQDLTDYTGVQALETLEPAVVEPVVEDEDEDNDPF